MSNNNLNIFSFIVEQVEQHNCKYDSSFENINLNTDNPEGTKREFSSKGINVEIAQGLIRIEVKIFDFVLFWCDQEFRRKKVKYKSFQTDIGIINKGGESKFFEYETEKTYINGIIDDNNHFFSNTRNYLELLTFLKDKAESEDNEFHFVDHYDENTRKILLTSFKDPGKLIIPFPQEILFFEEKKDIGLQINRLKQAFSKENKHLPAFIKNELFQFLGRIDAEARMEILVKELNKILNKAEINFQVYLHDLSIDNLKKEYSEYKNKYFEMLSDILGKLSNQLIALPLTVAATVFAIIKVEDSFFALVLILSALIIVSVYLTTILRLHRHDVRFIESTFEKEYQSLLQSPFFKKYPTEVDDFQVVKNRIKTRIGHLKGLIYGYFGLMWLFNVILIGFILYMQMQVVFKTVSLILGGLILLLALLYYLFIYNVK